MIVLVRINSKDMMKNPPLGLLYVGDALKKAGFEVKVLHISEDDIYAYTETILKLNPLWVGFSVNTGWSMGAALEMSRQIKNRSSITVVWGNAHASLLPEQCLTENCIDFVVIGEGEITSVELSNALLKGEEIEQVKGIGHKNKNGNIIINELRQPIEHLDDYEMDWTLLDPEKYLFSLPEFGLKRAFQFITSRGCPHNCGFCYNQRFNKRRWRAHSEQFVIQKVLKLKKALNLDGIRFWDDNFFTNKKRSFSILEQIDLPYTAEIRVDYIDESFAEKLHHSKCRMVLLGFESGSNRILKLIRKETTKQMNLKALQILNKYPQIAIHPSFIVGFPTETMDEYKKTLEHFATMIETRPNFWLVRLGLYLPYPGCDLYDLAVERGFTSPEKIEEWDRLIWTTSSQKSISCVEWLKDKSEIEKDEEYLMLLFSLTKSRLLFGLMGYFVRKRIQNRYYRFEVELLIVKGLKAARTLLKNVANKL